MKVSHAPKVNEEGNIEPAHEIEILCAECGYDIDESELEADTCSDCGASLKLRQNTSIIVTTLPPAFGESM
jgi:rRNA maturation endonuclease Nob1